MSHTAVTNEKNIVKPEIIKSEIVLTIQELEQQRERYLKQIQKSVTMPGFRPGNTPISIIKKKYNGTAFYEGLENLLKDKTNDLLNSQSTKVLYYVYNFDNTGALKDDGTDKKIEIECLLEPSITLNVSDKEVQLVKYGFTAGQRKMYSDILILFNFLKDNSVDKLENFDTNFIITSEIKNSEWAKSEEEVQRKKSQMPLVIHHYQFQSYGLNKILSDTLEKNQTYLIDAKKWMDTLETNFPDKKLSLFEFLKTAADTNAEVEFTIKDIQAYPDMSQFLNNERIKQVFNLDENAEITLDLVNNKLSEIIDWVAEYFSGNENIKRGNEFINKLIQIDIPEDFIQKLYNHYVKEEDKKYFSVDLFKEEIQKQLENISLKNGLPNTFNPSANYDEFAIHVAKTYLIETLLSQLFVLDLNATKNYIIHSLQSADSKNKEQLLQNYHNRDSVFSFSKNLEQDVKVNFKLENINQVHFSEFIGVKSELFV